MAGQQGKLQVLTLNCWGLLGVSRHRAHRMQALAEYLSSPAAASLDIVCLQEVWVGSDAELLMAAAKAAGLAHGVHFQSGTFGAGLVTISRFPILHASFEQYAAAGDPLALTCGDYLAAKGVGWVQLETPAGAVDVFNTHLHANYSHKVRPHALLLGAAQAQGNGRDAPTDRPTIAVQVPLDNFAPYRISQVWHLTQTIRHISKAGSGKIILAGDLNCKPDSLEMALLRARLPQLTDAWQQRGTTTTTTTTSTGRPGNAPASTAPQGKQGSGAGGDGGGGGGESLEDPGFTCRHPDCTYASTRQVPERIDYVLTTLGVATCTVTLRQDPNGRSYSDHFAVQAELQLPLGSASGGGGGGSAANLAHGAGAAAAAEQAGAVPLVARGAAAEEVYEQSLQILSKGEARCRRARGQAYHAAALCLAICVACLATLLTPSLGGATLPFSSPFFSAASGSSTAPQAGSGPGVGAGWKAQDGGRAAVAAALGMVGSVVLAVVAMAFSALAATLLLKGLMADASQERALRMSGVSMRVAAARADIGGRGSSSGGGGGGGGGAVKEAARDVEKRQLAARLQAAARIGAAAAAQRLKTREGGGPSSISNASQSASPSMGGGGGGGTVRDRPESGAAQAAEEAAAAVTEAAMKVGALTKTAATAAGESMGSAVASMGKMGTAVTAALGQAFSGTGGGSGAKRRAGTPSNGTGSVRGDGGEGPNSLAGGADEQRG